MVRHRTLVLAVLAALVFGGAACSGGGGNVSSTSVGHGATLTRAGLIRNADAICKAFGHRMFEIFRDSSGDPATNAAQTRRFIDLFDRWMARLSVLAAPADDRGDWTRFLTLTKAQRPAYVAIRDAYVHNEIGRLGALYADSYAAAARASDFGASYGLHDCVVNVDTAVVPATRSDYLGQINNACSSAINALQHLHQPQSPDEYLVYLRDANPLFDQLLRDLRAQPPSAGDDQLLAVWINQLGVTVHDLRSLGDAVAAGDAADLRKLANRVARDGRRADGTARALGLDQCAGTASGSAV